jgi:hypothetical protein
MKILNPVVLQDLKAGRKLRLNLGAPEQAGVPGDQLERHGRPLLGGELPHALAGPRALVPPGGDPPALSRGHAKPGQGHGRGCGERLDPELVPFRPRVARVLGDEVLHGEGAVVREEGDEVVHQVVQLAVPGLDFELQAQRSALGRQSRPHFEGERVREDPGLEVQDGLAAARAPFVQSRARPAGQPAARSNPSRT